MTTLRFDGALGIPRASQLSVVRGTSRFKTASLPERPAALGEFVVSLVPRTDQCEMDVVLEQPGTDTASFAIRMYVLSMLGIGTRAFVLTEESEDTTRLFASIRQALRHRASCTGQLDHLAVWCCLDAFVDFGECIAYLKALAEVSYEVTEIALEETRPRILGRVMSDLNAMLHSESLI